MRKAILALVLTVSLCGCVTIISPGKSRMYFVQGAEFEIATKEADKIDYFVVLGVNNPENRAYYLEVEFQNPCSHPDPIKMDVTLAPNQDKVLLRSPVLGCIEPNRYYRVDIRTFDSPQKTHKVDHLVQKVYSLMDMATIMKNANKSVETYSE